MTFADRICSLSPHLTEQSHSRLISVWNSRISAVTAYGKSNLYYKTSFCTCKCTKYVPTLNCFYSWRDFEGSSTLRSNSWKRFSVGATTIYGGLKAVWQMLKWSDLLIRLVLKSSNMSWNQYVIIRSCYLRNRHCKRLLASDTIAMLSSTYQLC